MKVFLGLGSNMGNRREVLLAAIEQINKQIGKVISLSAFYDTAPVGFESENRFLNAVCCVETHLSASEIQKETEKIEKILGRKTKSANQIYHDRPIDIDVLLIGKEIVNTAKLTIPHPRMHERKFVLEPLAEIAPKAWHPVLKKTVEQLFREFTESQYR